MSIQLYMDEQVPRQITVGLRLRDIDVLTVQEDNFAGLSDLEIINRATQLSRVLFSRDDDLLVIAKDYQKRGQLFSGVIYSHQKNASIGTCVQDLEIIARVCNLEDCINQVQYLPL